MLWVILVACVTIGVMGAVVAYLRSKLATAEGKLDTASVLSQASDERVDSLEALAREKEADERAKLRSEAAAVKDVPSAIALLRARWVRERNPGAGTP